MKQADNKNSAVSAVKTAFMYAALIIMAVIMLIPFAWMLSASLKFEKDVFSFPIVWIPPVPQWGNYAEIWKKVPLLTGFFNTTKLTVCTTVLQLVTSSFAAYAFAKLSFKGRDTIFMMYVMTISIPWQVYMVPQYKMMTLFGLTDSHLGIILMHAFTAMGVFLMRQFFGDLPIELAESAKIDGCTPWGIFTKIYLPLSKPSVATLSIFIFIATWNDFLKPLIYLSDSKKNTLTLGIYLMQGTYSTNWPVLMATCTLSLLPALILFLCMQDLFVEGIAMSGIKG